MIGVLINPHAVRLRQTPALIRDLVQVEEQCAVTQRSSDTPEALERLLNAPIQVIAVAGGDGTVSSVSNALVQRVGLAQAHTLPLLLPLGCGLMDTVARAARVPLGEPLRVLTQARALLDRKHSEPIPRYLGSLRVISSLEARARVAFNVYSGALVRVLEELTRHRTRRFVLASTLAAQVVESAYQNRLSDPSRHLHLYLDDALRSTRSTLCWISALAGSAIAQARNPTTVDGAPNLHTWVSERPLGQALRALMMARFPTRSNTGLSRAKTVTFDLAEGLALDGHFFPAREPYVVRVEPGPRLPFLRLDT